VRPLKIDYAAAGEESEAWAKALQPVLALMLVGVGVIVLVGVLWWTLAGRG